MTRPGASRAGAWFAGLLLVVLALALNQYSVEYYLLDGKIHSRAVKAGLILLQLLGLGMGIYIIRSRPGWAGNFGLSLGMFMTAVLAVEAFAVTTGVLVSTEFEQRHRFFYEFLHPDEELGFKPRPNLQDFRQGWAGSGVSGVYSTDEKGFRNPRTPYSEAEIFFIGDSFTFGAWVPREQSFAGLLQTRLKQPVINLGVGGYGLPQYQILLQQILEQYKPRLAVLGIYANDLFRVHLPLQLQKHYQDAGWDRYEQAGYAEKSFIGAFLNLVISPLEFDKQQVEVAQDFWMDEARGASDDYIDGKRYTELEGIFADMLDAAQQSETQLLVFMLPSKESVYQDLYEKHFAPGYLKNEQQGYQRLCAIAREKQVTCVDLTTTLRAHRPAEGYLYFARDAHWNSSGHRVAADAMLPVLENALTRSP